MSFSAACQVLDIRQAVGKRRFSVTEFGLIRWLDLGRFGGARLVL